MGYPFFTRIYTASEQRYLDADLMAVELGPATRLTVPGSDSL